jgi:sec-independent protein translocase protein TatA
MPNIGPMELVIVLALALLVLGPKRLPAAGRSLGQGIREFRDSITGKGQGRDRGARELSGGRELTGLVPPRGAPGYAPGHNVPGGAGHGQPSPRR